MTNQKGQNWQNLVIIVSIICGSIIIGFVLTNNSQFSNRNSTTNLSKQQDSKTPEQSIREQYSMINNGEYKQAWENLSSSFRNNQNIFPNGFNSYKSWWTTVDYSEVQNVKIISKTDNLAIINVSLKFKMKNGKIFSEVRQVKLLWDNNNQLWLLDETKKIK